MSRFQSEELSFVVSNGLTIRGKGYGPSDGDPVFFLHGWMDNCATFDLVIPLLLASRVTSETTTPSPHRRPTHTPPPTPLRAVCLDFAGHGLSDARPNCREYSPQDYARDVLDVADRLGWSSFSIVSHSLGGIVGAIIAASFPERVLSLVLVESLGMFSMHYHETASYLRTAFSSEVIPNSVFSTREEGIDRRCQANVTGPLERVAAETLASRGLTKAANGQGYMWLYDPLLKIPSAFRPTNDVVVAILKSVQCPVLFIYAQDSLFGFPSWLTPSMLLSLPVWFFTYILMIWTGIFLRIFLATDYVKGIHHMAKMQTVLGYFLRLHALRDVHVVSMKKGGHHVHLIQPGRVASEIVSFWNNMTPLDSKRVRLPNLKLMLFSRSTSSTSKNRKEK